MSRRGRPWSWKRRLAYLATKYRKKILRESADRISDVHVRACISCRSTQLCEPWCRLAPWNLEDA